MSAANAASNGRDWSGYRQWSLWLYGIYFVAIAASLVLGVTHPGHSIDGLRLMNHLSWVAIIACWWLMTAARGTEFRTRLRLYLARLLLTACWVVLVTGLLGMLYAGDAGNAFYFQVLGLAAMNYLIYGMQRWTD